MSDAGGLRHQLVRAGLAAMLIAALVVAGAVIVRAANGRFAGKYELSGVFPGTGQGLFPGSDVDYRGVPVGTVTRISLAGYRTRIGMSIDRTFRIPADAVATVYPKNVFGTEEVSLSFPSGPSGPFLAAGGHFHSTSTSPEIGDLLATADPILQKLDATALSSVISGSAQATNGEGPTIARGFQNGSKAAHLLAGTISAQIATLEAFQNFSRAIAGTGPIWNQLASDANLALPVLNAAAPSYRRVLTMLTALSNDIASLVTDYRPDIATLLADGDNVNRVLLANKANIENVVTGLYEYLYKFGNGASSETLPDGSKFAYFKIFTTIGDLNSLVCSMLQPAMASQGAAGGASSPLAYLATLESAINQAGGPVTCGAPPPLGAPSGTLGTTSAVPVASAAERLAQQIYSDLGSPQPAAGSGTRGTTGPPSGSSGNSGSLQSLLGMLG